MEIATGLDELPSGSKEVETKKCDFTVDPFDLTPEAFKTYSDYLGIDDAESRALWNQIWYVFS
jgi:hypothetical protein